MVRRDRREIENFQSGDVTDVILNRRRLLKRAGALGLGVPALAGLGAVLGPH
ncbi:MAG: hypothetical protein QOF33_2771, partial [Thermomicrobiales bacterium]|nr:hypothetical protein [Thermomicrobiales bacterium]